MAQKTIQALTLISALADTATFVVDDGIQTYRCTGPQLFSYLRPKFSGAVTVSAAGTTLDSTNYLVLLDPTSLGFSQALPACASLSVGFVLEFKNIATNGNIATLDASGSELIDNATTLALGSDPVMESAKLYNTGSKWLII